MKDTRNEIETILNSNLPTWEKIKRINEMGVRA